MTKPENNFKEIILGRKAIKVSIKPSSPCTELTDYDPDKDLFYVKLKAVPEKGRANRELLRFLQRLLNRKVKIISGSTSRIKLIKIL